MVRAWWLGLCVQRYKLLLIMKMNRCILLALPLLFMLSSCGTTAQYAQQRYQDGIYSRPEPVAEAVQLYSKEDFAAMAAANIAREGKDTVYVVVQHDDWWYDSPWFAWSSAWAFSWPYRHWAFSGWYSPWYGWSRPWYDPWYSWYYDPWFYDPWYSWHYYDPWYHPPVPERREAATTREPTPRPAATTALPAPPRSGAARPTTA